MYYLASGFLRHSEEPLVVCTACGHVQGVPEDSRCANCGCVECLEELPPLPAA